MSQLINGCSHDDQVPTGPIDIGDNMSASLYQCLLMGVKQEYQHGNQPDFSSYDGVRSELVDLWQTEKCNKVGCYTTAPVLKDDEIVPYFFYDDLFFRSLTKKVFPRELALCPKGTVE